MPAAESVSVTSADAFTAPLIVSADASVSEKFPAVTANPPSAPIAFVADVSDTSVFAPDVLCNVPAVIVPALWLIPPATAERSTTPVDVAFSTPDSAISPADATNVAV